jgi:succinate dehydrogenase hydrophobic anchor subunit
MAKNTNPTFRDLTLDEAWRLTKRFFSAVLVCALVFVLPYLLLTSASKYADVIVGDKTASEWTGYLLSFVVLLFVVFHISDLFSTLAEMFADLANLTKSNVVDKENGFCNFACILLFGLESFPNNNLFCFGSACNPCGVHL